MAIPCHRCLLKAQSGAWHSANAQCTFLRRNKGRKKGKTRGKKEARREGGRGGEKEKGRTMDNELRLKKTYDHKKILCFIMTGDKNVYYINPG